jgi:hypothetical protein
MIHISITVRLHCGANSFFSCLIQVCHQANGPAGFLALPFTPPLVILSVSSRPCSFSNPTSSSLWVGTMASAIGTEVGGCWEKDRSNSFALSFSTPNDAGVSA